MTVFTPFPFAEMNLTEVIDDNWCDAERRCEGGCCLGRSLQVGDGDEVDVTVLESGPNGDGLAHPVGVKRWVALTPN